MIDLKLYWKGRDKTHPSDLTPAIIKNASDLLAKVNALLSLFGYPRGVNSGWRPKTVQMEINPRAPNSKHITGQAIDLEDRDGKLKEWCVFHQDQLERFGLYMEHPEDTPTWVHLQTVPPKSGKRIFKP